MCPYIHIILPSYGVLAFLGGFLSLLVLYFRIEQFSISFSDFLRLFFLCALGGFIGSKLLFMITRLLWLIQNFSLSNFISLIFHSGYVFYGGLFGVICTINLYGKKTKKYEAKQLFQFSVPAFPLFHCFGRIGCLMAGCCYGVELQSPIRIANISINRFPTQISEALFEILAFGTLLTFEKESNNDLLQSYLFAYALFRFLIEFLRGDEIRGVFIGLSTSQWISLMIICHYVIKKIKKVIFCPVTGKYDSNQ